MRKALHEFFRPTREEFEKLWRDALITFDASSLLNLYGYSAETKGELVEAYEKFKERIILPYQFAREYSENRANVIGKQISNYQKAEKDLAELIKKHEAKQEQPYLSRKSRRAVSAILSELAEGRSRLEKSMAVDEDSDLLLKLFEGRVSPEPSAEQLGSLYSEGRGRYDTKTPPGFADLKEKGEPDCYGDYIAWKQIMAIATDKKRDFILVTDDVKDDWWHYEGSRLVGPLPELRKEFKNVTGQSVWLYTTDGFLRAAKEFAEAKVGDAALSETKAALETQLAERLQRFLKVSLSEVSKSDIESLEKYFAPERDETKKLAAPSDGSDSEEDEP